MTELEVGAADLALPVQRRRFPLALGPQHEVGVDLGQETRHLRVAQQGIARSG